MKHSSPGFTLIEVLLGMAIFAAVILLVIGMQSLLLSGQEFSLTTVQTIENANTSLHTLTNELRRARQSETGAFPLEEGLDQQIVFYANVDADEEIEQVRYFLEGIEMKKGVVNPTLFPASYPLETEAVKVVSENIRNGADPVFYYYNEDWPTDQVNNPLPTPANLTDVTLVKISVRVNTDPNDPQEEYSLEPFVQIRSLKKNL